MKKTAVALGMMLALSAMTVTAQTATPVAAKPVAGQATQASADFCKINLTSTAKIKAKPGAKLKRAKAKRPGKYAKGAQRISRKPQMDVCDMPDNQQATKPVAQQGAGGNGAAGGTGAAAPAGGAALPPVASTEKLPEGDLTKVLEPTAAGPVAAAPAFAAPAFAPATFTSAPSFGGGGGGVGVASPN